MDREGPDHTPSPAGESQAVTPRSARAAAGASRSSSPTQTAVTSTCATRGSSDTATGVNSDQVSLSREPS